MAPDYCSLRDLLYSLDSTIWFKSAKSLLSILDFPINNTKNSEPCSFEEFLFLDLSIFKKISYKEKQMLENIITITKLYLSVHNEIKCFAIEIDSNIKNRTEIAIKITEILSEAISCYNILIFKNDLSIAFTGTSFSKDNSILELFISEWFEYNMSENKYHQLQEIEFYGDYFDYLYSIARPYQKNREVKMCLAYTNGYIKQTLKYKKILNIYEKRENYFREFYGYDYYEEFIIRNYEKKEDDEIKWTLLELELELANSDSKKEYEEDGNHNGEDDDFKGKYYDGFFDIEDPEEMLKLIRGELYN